MRIALVLLLHVGAIAALFHFTWKGFWAFVLLQWLTAGLGISMCYHRLLAHRAYQILKPLEYLLTLFGCLAWLRGPTQWVAAHKLHHARADQPNDPHSPTQGFLWGHMGWTMARSEERDRYERYRAMALDIDKNRVHRFLNATANWYPPLLGIALLMWGGWSVFLWGFCLRTVFVWHAVWSVNSAAHTWGYRRWRTKDQSTNNACSALLSYGDGWHHNHHAFPRSAAHGLRWWELDLTFLTLRLLKIIRVVSQIQLPAPEIQKRLAISPQETP